MEILAFYAIAIEPIKLQTCSASQNDRLNLSFVKDAYGNVEKMARKGGKMVIYESQILRLTLYLTYGIFILYFLDSTTSRGQKYKTFFFGFLVQMTSLEFAFEIN